MKTKAYRLGVLALALSMVFGLCVPSMAAGYQNECERSQIRGTFYFDPHEGGTEIGDLPDTYVYSDAYFEASSYETNAHLATMSMQLAAASISSCSYDRSEDAYNMRSRNVENLLEQLGFEETEVNEYYNKKMNENTLGVAVAYKCLDNDTVLLAMVPRSAGYEIEWSGNFNVGETTEDGLHLGFKTGRDIALDFADEYVSEHSDIFSGKTLKVWTVGYSRGAAVANLIGAAMAEGYELGKTGEKIHADSQNVYAYTFGTPNTVLPQNGANPRDSFYNGIHNYYASYDPVKMTPFSTWGFTRYGQDTLLPTDDADTKALMLSFLQNTNKYVYDIYVNGGGDPDTFAAMCVDTASGAILHDESSALTQETFLEERVAYLTNYLVKNRDSYVDDRYQDMLCTLMVLMFGGDGHDMSRLIAQIMNDENKTDAIVSGVGLLLYSVLQGCVDQFGEDADINVQDLVKLAKLLVKLVIQLMPTETNAAALTDEELYNEAYAAFIDSFCRQLPDSPEKDALIEAAAAISENDTDARNGFTYSAYAKIVYDATVKSIGKLLDACVENAEFTNLEKENLPVRLTDREAFIKPFVKFIAAAAVGTELSEEQKAKNSFLQLMLLQLNTAVTLYTNVGKYMRVHNNEVILSWVRTMEYDSEKTKPSCDAQYDLLAYFYNAVAALQKNRQNKSKETKSYALTAETSEYGVLQLSADYAAAGEVITVKVVPNDGYTLSALTVTAENGQTPTITALGDGDCTFTMPESAVTVQATFDELPAVTPQYSDFSDLPADAWYRSGVEYVLAENLMNGTSESTFAPEDGTNRAMVLTVLWRLEGSPIVNYALQFTDVQPNAWYTEAIRWAASEGITTGYDDGRFGVDDIMTHEQLVTILYRYAMYKGYDVSVGEDTNILDYDDAFDITEYAVPAMQWGCGSGVAAYQAENNASVLDPQGCTTRAQLAVMLMRFCEWE